MTDTRDGNRLLENASEFMRKVAEAVGVQLPQKGSWIDLDELYLQVLGYVEELKAETASPAPRHELKHPTRTIIVATRLSEKTLRTTYLNALDDEVPYVVTIDLNEPPHTPVSGVVPDVGETKVVVER